MLKISYGKHMLMLLITSFSPHGMGVLFRTGALLITHCIPFLEVLSVAYLTGISINIITLELSIFFYVSHDYVTVAVICVTKM